MEYTKEAVGVANKRKLKDNKSSAEAEGIILGKESQKLDKISDLENEESVRPKKIIRNSVSTIRKCSYESPKKEETKLASNDNRPRCKYGRECYRKNPQHFKEFSHFGEEPLNKKSRLDTNDMESPSSSTQNNLTPKVMKESHPSFGFYLTKVKGLAPEYNQHSALDLKDIFSLTKAKLKASAQFNYMTDIPWLMKQYPAEYRSCPLLIVHGEQRGSKSALEKAASVFPNITLCNAKLEIMYGTHHTKMMLLLYDSGLRIVIHTANLIENDWFQKTQGIWISPLFPSLLGEQSAHRGNSATNFKGDLLEYLSFYNRPDIDEWCKHIKGHDLSNSSVFLIGSIPGRHLAERKTSFGHLKLRKVLNLHGPEKSLVTSSWPLIGQFSSIGSLGTDQNQWLCGEWLASLGTVKGCSLTSKTPLQLVFPTVNNVRESLEGYPAGTSLPYSINVAKKQPYLRNFLYQWKSDRLSRSHASPHIKTYLRVSPDNSSVAWFLLTSANLSKAAWGVLEKNGSQFMIRSYELGVLFMPQYLVSRKVFGVPEVKERKANMETISFPVPYDIPLIPYSNKDEIWIWDIPHIKAPDRHGNKWCPPLPRT
ncbi:tyrosyl-DNA phosphodiesterase 1-like [Limulus polyphemus]|uniref:Tyrosyl-DNA phosphodiesterase 1-like n=1 Tax=Limulus polyphemus TaxID=6850 RepID=A0ABM1BDP3_LIMPO|nr:tyrosyl-DNA phosphodiesterase 1-like [Limulus polyphemus]